MDRKPPPDWTRSDDGMALLRSYRFANFAEAFVFLTRVAAHAEAVDHHPEFTSVWNRVDFRLTSHDAGGLTARDIELAEAIDGMVSLHQVSAIDTALHHRGTSELATRGDIKNAGFEGFVPIADLRADPLIVPDMPGVYLIVRPDGFAADFVDCGSGGHFKGRNPNQPVDVLRANWIEDAIVLNIGKAGGGGSGSTLRKRLRQYMRFGDGFPVGHWGGRFIWQLLEREKLQVCWKVTEDPRTVEAAIISAFKNAYGSRPFANLAD